MAKFCEVIVTVGRAFTMYHLCCIANWSIMVDYSTLSYCNSSKAQAIWKKFSKGLFTMYLL